MSIISEFGSVNYITEYYTDIKIMWKKYIYIFIKSHVTLRAGLYDLEKYNTTS